MADECHQVDLTFAWLLALKHCLNTSLFVHFLQQCSVICILRFMKEIETQTAKRVVMLYQFVCTWLLDYFYDVYMHICDHTWSLKG